MEASPGGNEGWPFIVQHMISVWRCGEQSLMPTLWSELPPNNPRSQPASCFNLPLQPPDFIQEWRQSHLTALWHLNVLSTNIYKARACKHASCLPPFSTLVKASCWINAKTSRVHFVLSPDKTVMNVIS